MLDRNRVQESFENYLSIYQRMDTKVQMKKKHTYRVADLSYKIAESLTDDNEYKNLCWLIGLLHDIGRFEQLKRFGTFLDSESVDHAELGADILFKDSVIEQFLAVPITDMNCDQENRIIELSIRNHNKYRIQDGLNDEQRFFCNVIRDADKVDIFRVISETPYELRMSKKQSDSLEPAREEVMRCIESHSSVKTLENMTRFESSIMGCAMGFDLVYERSKEIVREQGYFKKMLQYEPKSLEQKRQMEMIRKELSYLC